MIVHEVITAERVPFRYRVAGIGSRFLAWLVDINGILLLVFLGMVAANQLEVRRAGVGVGFLMIWIFVVQWGYFLFFEWLWHGQTPGKRLLGIRVIQLQGTSVTFAQAAVRNILRYADAPPLPLGVLPFPILTILANLLASLVPFQYSLGFVVAVCNREQRRLGDLAAGTLVVHVERRRGPIQSLPEVRADSERTREALIRQRLSQLDKQQKQTLLDLCLRRDQLGVSDRARLFQATAEYFRERLDLAPLEYQSDEKFVLELAAALSGRATMDGARDGGLRRPDGTPV